MPIKVQKKQMIRFFFAKIFLSVRAVTWPPILKYTNRVIYFVYKEISFDNAFVYLLIIPMA